MNDIVPAHWRHVINATIGATALFAAGLVLFPTTMQLLFLPMFHGVSEPPPGFSADAMHYVHFAFAMTGCVMLAWLLALAVVVNGPFRRGEAWAYKLVAGSIGLWFVTDNVCSLAMGFTANVAFNTMAVLPAAVALAMSYRCFFPAVQAVPAPVQARDAA